MPSHPGGHFRAVNYEYGVDFQQNFLYISLFFRYDIGMKKCAFSAHLY